MEVRSSAEIAGLTVSPFLPRAWPSQLLAISRGQLTGSTGTRIAVIILSCSHPSVLGRSPHSLVPGRLGVDCPSECSAL
jgi:hypothetical protein